MARLDRRINRQVGMTLIELLVVLVILGLIASIAGPKVMNYFGEAKSKSAKIQIEGFGQTLDLFKISVGRYPTTSEGLAALVQAPSGVSNWTGPYLRKDVLPKDPWNNDYKYTSPGQHGAYDIVSYGADGREGGEGENKDIHSWD
ncbi:MAG: type II secretion system major pseudopilin GspG [Betaproteobacteria bacterium]|jgi:general secretion pathway protein G|nr:type II secretion system major pseudopilin GspG [Betaproteobacteria bacterium]